MKSACFGFCCSFSRRSWVDGYGRPVGKVGRFPRDRDRRYERCRAQTGSRRVVRVLSLGERIDEVWDRRKWRNWLRILLVPRKRVARFAGEDAAKAVDALPASRRSACMLARLRLTALPVLDCHGRTVRGDRQILLRDVRGSSAITQVDFYELARRFLVLRQLGQDGSILCAAWKKGRRRIGSQTAKAASPWRFRWPKDGIGVTVVVARVHEAIGSDVLDPRNSRRCVRDRTRRREMSGQGAKEAESRQGSAFLQPTRPSVRYVR